MYKWQSSRTAFRVIVYAIAGLCVWTETSVVEMRSFFFNATRAVVKREFNEVYNDCNYPKNITGILLYFIILYYVVIRFIIVHLIIHVGVLHIVEFCKFVKLKTYTQRLSNDFKYLPIKNEVPLIWYCCAVISGL